MTQKLRTTKKGFELVTFFDNGETLREPLSEEQAAEWLRENR